MNPRTWLIRVIRVKVCPRKSATLVLIRVIREIRVKVIRVSRETGLDPRQGLIRGIRVGSAPVA